MVEYKTVQLLFLFKLTYLLVNKTYYGNNNNNYLFYWKVTVTNEVGACVFVLGTVQWMDLAHFTEPAAFALPPHEEYSMSINPAWFLFLLPKISRSSADAIFAVIESTFAAH